MEMAKDISNWKFLCAGKGIDSILFLKGVICIFEIELWKYVSLEFGYGTQKWQI